MKVSSIVFLYLVILGSQILLAKGAYVVNDYGRVSAGNDYYQIEIATREQRFQPQWIINKQSKNRYRISGSYFRLLTTHLGEDITPPKDSPPNRAAGDFILENTEEMDIKVGKEVRFNFSGHGLSLILHLLIPNDQPILRTYLEVKNTWQSSVFLEKIEVLNANFSGLILRHGGFGQPVYGEDIFFGVEFPAAYTEAGPGERVSCWHYAAEKLPMGRYYRSHTAVIGFTPLDHVRQSFMQYIESVRPQPTRPFPLYNTWYDIRDFSYPKLFDTIENFKATLVDRYDLQLDAFVIDDGWDNLQSLWEIDSTRFPQGFNPITEKLKEINSSMGLWISPWNGYGDARDQRMAWARAKGYKTSGMHLCLGSEKYFREFKDKVIRYLKEGDLSFYKIDGFLSVCNESDHQHLPGIYSREKLTRRFVKVLQALRSEKPDIFIDITVGTWLSPWWLMHADAVWMTGADFGHAEDVPAYSERDKAITFRDYTLYKDFVRDVLQFPLANVMTHGIIKGKLNMLGGENETLRNWQDNAVMYFSRGVMMWELYLSPEVLTDAEWDFLAAMMEWAYHYEEILLNTRFVGGNPYRKKTYGYFHEGKETSLLIIRNPFVAPQTITFTMTDLFLVAQDNSYVIEELYPCKIIHRDPLTFSRPVTIPLQGYEVKVLRLLPSKALKYALPAGIHLQPIERKKNEVTYRVFTNPLEESCADFAGEAWLTSLRLNNRKIKADEFRRLICKGNKFNRTHTEYRFNLSYLSESAIEGKISVPGKMLLSNARIGMLLEFEKAIDSLDIAFQGVSPSDAIIKKGAAGAWYWLLIPVEKVDTELSFQIKSINTVQMQPGVFSIWELGVLPLESVGTLQVESKNPPPAEAHPIPVSADQKKITRRLFQGAL